jgi:hypothetical protein
MLDRLIRKVKGEKLDTIQFVQPSDVVLASYPKSGRTWLMFILTTLLEGKSDFDSAHDRFPAIWKAKQSQPQDRSIKFWRTHDHYDPAFKKVIYLVRDPRAVVVSFYYHLRKRFMIEDDFDAFFDEFLDGDPNGMGTWEEHVKSWSEKLTDASVFLIRYEDLVQRGDEVIGKLAEFLAIDASSDAIRQAIEANSFENMQAMELKGGGRLDRQKDTDQSIRNVREGRIDGYKKHLSAEQEDQLLTAWNVHLKKFDYK